MLSNVSQHLKSYATEFTHPLTFFAHWDCGLLLLRWRRGRRIWHPSAPRRRVLVCLTWLKSKMRACDLLSTLLYGTPWWLRTWNRLQGSPSRRTGAGEWSLWRDRLLRWLVRTWICLMLTLLFSYAFVFFSCINLFFFPEPQGPWREVDEWWRAGWAPPLLLRSPRQRWKQDLCLNG